MSGKGDEESLIYCQRDSWCDLAPSPSSFGQMFNQEEDGQRSSSMRCRTSPPSSLSAPPPEDKKMRREIANSNERRRMMCINNGFVSLQMILPKHYMKRGEKMSKAAVLQSTVDYISKLVMDNAKLQSKNEALLQKVHSARLDSTGESSDEGISVLEQESDQTVSSAKDLVTMVQHWREKYSRERCLRDQAIEEFRRLSNDQQYCPAGCSKRELYHAALLRRNKSPTPDNDDDLMGPFCKAEEAQNLSSSQQQRPSLPVKSESTGSVIIQEERQAPSLMHSSSSDQLFPVQSSSGSSSKRRSKSVKEDDGGAKIAPLTGFEILYQAITFSENMDGSKSDSGCSEETFDSNEPPKKRRKQQAQPSTVINMERVCS